MKLFEVFGLFRRWNTVNRAPRTAAFYAEQLKRLIEQHGDTDVNELRPVDLVPFRQSCHFVKSLQRLYHWAVQHDLAKPSPILKLRRPRTGTRRRVLSRRDIQRLMRRARYDFRRIILAARETGARPGELLDLDWDSVHFPDEMSRREALGNGKAFFLLTEYKSRKLRKYDTAQRVIPISPRFGRLLCRLLERQGNSGKIFLTWRGISWTYNAMCLRMRTLKRVCGLPFSVRGEQICAYTLRHSAATQWIADGLSTFIVKELLGHTRLATTQRYVHVSKTQVLEEWRRYQQRRGR